MPTAPERFYVTTPIYYVNAVPHLGTFYTTVVADALARHHRARGHETFFLTGTDEHGQKIERIARDTGVSPKAHADGIVAAFKQTWERVGITYDRFIRTTDEDHRAAVVAMWRRMADKGDLYVAEYDGLYCVGCEEWKSEDDVVTEGGEKLCPIHRRPVEKLQEKNYFFRLSKYADRLLELYQQPDFIRPESRRNEVAEFVKGGLRDISVSRAAVKWGIPVPDDPEHVIYVWIDALTNYLTAIGGPAAVQAGTGQGSLWSASHHLIAKDILRFHAVYWPAMLMSADLPPPKAIFCHGYITVKGQKISKSMPATRVDPNAIADELGVDPLRYFVLREYAFGADGDFTYEALFQRYESELGNDLGNLVNRTISMARREFGDAVPARAAHAMVLPESDALRATVDNAISAATAHWEAFAPGRALDETWAMIRAGNQYVDKTAPWKLAKLDDKVAVREVLANCLEVIRVAAQLVTPAIPQSATEILRQLGRAADIGAWPKAWTGWPGGTLQEPKPIFPRLDPDRQKALIARWVGESQGESQGESRGLAQPGAAPPAPPISGAPPTAPTAAATAAATGSDAAPAEITIDDFAKIDLRAAKVLSAERVPKTDKLLKLELELGSERRIVVSGIAGAYQPEALVGKTVVYLANLKPAKLRGVLSQGMILAAGDKDVLALSALDRDVPPGTKIR